MSNRLERIIRIDTAIRNGTYPSARKLAQELEVSERTLYGDRDYLIDRLGAPIEFDDELGGWYYRDETYVLPAILATEGEFLALLLSAELAEHYLGTTFEAPLRSAVKKIAAYLPDRLRIDLDAVSQQYSFPAGATVLVQASLLADLNRALKDHRRVRITYYTASRDQQRERLVNPYHLCNNRGDWYLIAHDDWRKDVRMFHAGRILDWSLTDERFEPDPHFSVTKYLARSFVTERGGEVADVAIRFDAVQSRWIRERQWHPTQRLELQPDGGLILHLHTGGLAEVKRWVMGYGAHAEVLAPPALRAEIAAEIEQMRETYRGTESPVQ